MKIIGYNMKCTNCTNLNSYSNTDNTAAVIFNKIYTKSNISQERKFNYGQKRNHTGNKRLIQSNGQKADTERYNP